MFTLSLDFNLEWAATNSHFVLGLIGFMYMVGLRGYILLLEAEASQALILSTLSGVGAALLLMVSIVNQGILAGGGALGETYGTTTHSGTNRRRCRQVARKVRRGSEAFVQHVQGKGPGLQAQKAVH